MGPGFRRETDLEQPIEPFRKHLAEVDEVEEADLEGAAQRSAVTVAARRLARSDQNVDFNRAAGKDRAMKKQIITIAGSPGSGKSSTAKAIAAVLGFEHFSSGDFFRQLAVERGQSIEAMNISAEVQRDIDHKVDNLLQQMYRTADRLVIDSRMAWHWMPESFKVFLMLDPATAAERIFAHLQDAGRLSEDAASVAEVRRSIDRRSTSERKRYAALYDVDATDPLNFDVVINTKHNDLNTVAAMVSAAYQGWQGTAAP